MIRHLVLLVCALASTQTLAADRSMSLPNGVVLRGDFIQGGMVAGQGALGARVVLDGADVPVSRDGFFLLGFSRGAEPIANLDIQFAGRHAERQRIAIDQRDYDIQRIDGLPRRKVTPDPEDLIRIRAEGLLMQDARSGKALQLGFQSGFVWPARGLISGVYGSQRILNGEPRRPHFGVDIAAPTGTPVIAPADGQVTLVHPDMFFNGKSIVLDHGLGFTTVYIHLSDASVQPGQWVKQGEVIGKIGETGRVTGPHLHWGARVRNIEIDPALLVEGKPQPLNGP